MNTNEFNELCFDYIKEVAGIMYKKGVRQEKEVITASFDQLGGFNQWLGDGDKLLSMSAIIEIMEYVSEYGKKKCDSSRLGHFVRHWVSFSMKEPFILSVGHTTNTLLCLYGEALMHNNVECAFQFIGQVFKDLDRMDLISEFDAMIVLDSLNDSMFHKWIKNDRFRRRRIPCFPTAPLEPIKRQVCIVYRTFAEKCVDNGISYKTVRDRFFMDMRNRDMHINEIQELLDLKHYDPLSDYSAEFYVDEIGWTLKHLLVHFEQMDTIRIKPRRSERIAKRKRL